MTADPPVSVDVNLWLKDGNGQAAVYPTTQARSWKNVAATSTRTREETAVAAALTPGVKDNVCLSAVTAGEPGPRITNNTVDGKQKEFTYGTELPALRLSRASGRCCPPLVRRWPASAPP